MAFFKRQISLTTDFKASKFSLLAKTEQIHCKCFIRGTYIFVAGFVLHIIIICCSKPKTKICHFSLFFQVVNLFTIILNCGSEKKLHRTLYWIHLYKVKWEHLSADTRETKKYSSFLKWSKCKINSK